jgi:hypothetical protein
MGSLLSLIIVGLMIASMWKVFTKAGQPGWASLIPIYNLIVLVRIAGKPVWWVLLMLIPFVNIIALLFVYLALARAFGKSDAYGVGLLLLPFVFFPLLAFGDARYIGPQSSGQPRPQAMAT